MSKSLIPALQGELQKLDRDPDNQRPSLKHFRVYAKDLDPQLIPLFVAEFSEAIDATGSCEDDDIMVFEMLARFHGQKVVPSIGQIMSIITKVSLALNARSVSKVVCAIALYGINPFAHIEDKMKIIQCLCKPLSDALMSSKEIVSSGAAVCLRGLVNLDVWRFASNEIVNDICLKIAGALSEALTQSNSHICLVIDLAKHNSWVLEAYARSIIRSGLQILSCSLDDNYSQKRFLAIQMIDSLMRRIDARSFFSEIERIINTMEKCQYDNFSYVQRAAFEALQIAKIIAAHGGLRCNLDLNSNMSSDFESVCDCKESWIVPNYDANSNKSPYKLPSPQSQSMIYDSFVCSAISSERSSCNIQCITHANKKVWNADIDSKDGVMEDGFFRQVGLYGDTSMVYFEKCRNSGLKEETHRGGTTTKSSDSSSMDIVAESASNSAKRSWPIGDKRTASSPLRRLILSPHSCQNCAVKNYTRPGLRMLQCPSSEDQLYIFPDEYHNHTTANRRAVSNNLEMSKEHQIHNELLGDGNDVPSYLGTSLASDSIQACIKPGLNVSKGPLSLICSLSMILLVVILAISIVNRKVLFDVVPT